MNSSCVLRLYVVGATPASQRAIANLTALCEQHLPGRHTLEVIDIYQRPDVATDAQIIAAPTLVRLLPEPVVRIVGDLSDRLKVLAGLDIEFRRCLTDDPAPSYEELAGSARPGRADARRDPPRRGGRAW